MPTASSGLNQFHFLVEVAGDLMVYMFCPWVNLENGLYSISIRICYRQYKCPALGLGSSIME